VLLCALQERIKYQRAKLKEELFWLELGLPRACAAFVQMFPYSFPRNISHPYLISIPVLTAAADPDWLGPATLPTPPPAVEAALERIRANRATHQHSAAAAAAAATAATNATQPFARAATAESLSRTPLPDEFLPQPRARSARTVVPTAQRNDFSAALGGTPLAGPASLARRRQRSTASFAAAPIVYLLHEYEIADDLRDCMGNKRRAAFPPAKRQAIR
jgi:hypothetical protein